MIYLISQYILFGQAKVRHIEERCYYR